MYKLPERRGGGGGGEVIRAMPERKHLFLNEVFPYGFRKPVFDTIPISFQTLISKVYLNFKNNVLARITKQGTVMIIMVKMMMMMLILMLMTKHSVKMIMVKMIRLKLPNESISMLVSLSLSLFSSGRSAKVAQITEQGRSIIRRQRGGSESFPCEGRESWQQ